MNRGCFGVCTGIGLIALAVAGCQEAHPAPNLPPTPVVRVSPATEEEVVDNVYFTGRTDAVESVEVRARVTGYLVEIGFKPGDEVKTGEVLFKIDPRPYQAALDQALGALALSKARLKLALADLARAQEIAKTPGAMSKQDFDKYSAAQAQADAEVQSSAASVEAADLNLKFTDVTSPIDGRASRNLLTIGNLVSQDTTLLTTIVSEDPIYAYFDVDERTMLKVQQMIRDGKFKGVREGATIKVHLGLTNEGDEYPHEGTLDFVNNQVNSSTGTLQVRGVLPNPSPPNNGPRLLSAGLFVRVRLPLGAPHMALVVPQAAVVTEQGQKLLLAVNDKNVVEARPVTMGAVQPDGRQVVEPVEIVRSDKTIRVAREGERGEPSLKAGDSVIVTGLQRVRPGATVDPKPL